MELSNATANGEYYEGVYTFAPVQVDDGNGQFSRRRTFFPENAEGWHGKVPVPGTWEEFHFSPVALKAVKHYQTVGALLDVSEKEFIRMHGVRAFMEVRNKLLRCKGKLTMQGPHSHEEVGAISLKEKRRLEELLARGDQARRVKLYA